MTLIKRITCSVRDGDRGRFDAAQRRWSQIADQPGLIVQAGGWDSAAPAACVLACWTGAEAYRDFMEGRHDQVAADSGQAGTYQAIEVATGESELTMPGAARTLAGAVSAGVFLRVADCQVRPERREHFVAAQRETWLPGMAAADGMLGGLFSRPGDYRYLVTTWWSSAGDATSAIDRALARTGAEMSLREVLIRLRRRPSSRAPHPAPAQPAPAGPSP
jgi:hypothetical protein